MNDVKIISGATEEEIWQQITNDLSTENIFEYNVIIQQGTQQVELNIDVDLGGGFESGYQLTTFTSPLKDHDDFRFAIHKQAFLDEIGKFFGMQDVTIGYPEFDKNVVVKTNDEARVKTIFADAGARQFFQSMDDFTFGITIHEHMKVLEFSLERGVIEPRELRAIYHSFCAVLVLLSP